MIIGAGYDTSADIWSVACLAYELATGDYLFDPKKSKAFSRDEDHLARIIELLGPIPLPLILCGKFSKKYFTHLGICLFVNYNIICSSINQPIGDLRLQVERYSLFQLLTERHNWPTRIAKLFAEFLLMMLNTDPDQRATASECLQHPFMRESFDFSELQNHYERESYYSRESGGGSSYQSSASGGGDIVDDSVIGPPHPHYPFVSPHASHHHPVHASSQNADREC